jgi:hypothetical protein
MAMATKQNQPERGAMSGLERLSLRVSSMVNHPVAQIQRWVTIHRLDTDGEREWEEVMGLISETDAIEMTFNDDESVTIRWELSGGDEHPTENEEEVEMGMAPF